MVEMTDCSTLSEDIPRETDSTKQPMICKRCCIRISLQNSPSRQYKDDFMSLLDQPVTCPQNFQLIPDITNSEPLLTSDLVSRPEFTCYLCAGILQGGCIEQLLETCSSVTGQYRNVSRVGVSCSNSDLLNVRAYVCGVGKIDLGIRAVFKWILGDKLSEMLGVPLISGDDVQNRFSMDLTVNVDIDINETEFKWTCKPPLSWDVYDSSQGKFKIAKLKDALEKSSHDDIKHFLTLPGKPISFKISAETSPIFIGGRYTKHARNISQTPWNQQDGLLISCNVEDVLCKPLLAACKADEGRMHAAGREDIDVRMLGNGRPFYIQLNNARVFPSQTLLSEIEQQINSTNKHVKCSQLTSVTKVECDIVKQGQDEKQKEYRCIVKAESEVTEAMLVKLDGISDLELEQTTPIRVLHRRTPMKRPKRIIKVNARLLSRAEVQLCTGDDQLTDSLMNRLLVVGMVTEAGTYVKEFVHGDFNRTTPNVGSIIGNRCDILQLDVMNVTMNWPPSR